MYQELYQRFQPEFHAKFGLLINKVIPELIIPSFTREYKGKHGMWDAIEQLLYYYKLYYTVVTFVVSRKIS